MTTRVKFEKRAVAYNAPWAQGVGTYYVSGSPLWALRQHLESLSLTRFKAASLGGEQESGFEQAFASLAYAYVRDKSPRLLDFMVGFQLVERNQDNTKAMGIFGYRVGDRWMYGPVFFLNGDLKGHELLYLKKSNTFVPLKENWVNYIISQKPHQLGDPSDETPQDMGAQMPNLRRLITPPGYGKMGSDGTGSDGWQPAAPRVQGWVRPFLPFVAAGATVEPFGGAGYDLFFAKHAGVSQRLDLRRFLGEDIELLKAAHDLYESYPLIRKGFDTFYGKDFFVKVARKLRADASSLLPRDATKRAFDGDLAEAQARAVALNDVLYNRDRKRGKPKRAGDSLLEDAPPPGHPLKTGALRIFVYDRVTITQNLKELDEDDREKLMKDTVLIKDERDPHAQSTAYNVQAKAELVNPTEGGLYDVLEKPGTFDEMLVVTHPFTNKGKESFSVVVRLADTKSWLNTHQTNLWVKPNGKPEKKGFKEWFDKQPEYTSLEVGATYIFVGPDGSGTTPFTVRESHEDDTYKVDFKDYARYNGGRPRYLPRTANDRSGFGRYDDEYVSSYDALMTVNRRKGAALRAAGGELAVPVSFKAIKLQEAPKPKDDKSLLPCCDMESGSSSEPIRPGNLADVQMLLYEKTAQVKLMHHKGGSEVTIKSPLGERRLTKTAALIDLVGRHGFSEPVAREMLKEAELKESVGYRVKYAYGFGPMATGGSPGAPAFPEPIQGEEPLGYGSVHAQYPQEDMLPVSDLDSGRTDPRVYDPFYTPDKGAVQTAQMAAQSGQKEVFDTAMISGLLKAVRQDSIVDRYLGDLMKALDKIGRILFLFYWHQEEFEDRYGKQDLPELEDSLRNAFETLGDVTLFLKEKSVGSLDEYGAGVGNTASEPSVAEAARN